MRITREPVTKFSPGNTALARPRNERIALFASIFELGPIHVPEVKWSLVPATIDSPCAIAAVAQVPWKSPSQVAFEHPRPRNAHPNAGDGEKIPRKTIVITSSNVQAPHLLRRTGAACDLRFPSCHLWRGSVVSPERSPGAGQVLHPVLCESDHGAIRIRGWTEGMLYYVQISMPAKDFASQGLR